MKIRLAFLTITLIAVISSVFAYMSFIQTKTYENELVLFDGRLTIINSKFADLQEEGRGPQDQLSCPALPLHHTPPLHVRPAT